MVAWPDCGERAVGGEEDVLAKRSARALPGMACVRVILPRGVPCLSAADGADRRKLQALCADAGMAVVFFLAAVR